MMDRYRAADFLASRTMNELKGEDIDEKNS